MIVFREEQSWFYDRAVVFSIVFGATYVCSYTNDHKRETNTPTALETGTGTNIRTLER